MSGSGSPPPYSIDPKGRLSWQGCAADSADFTFAFNHEQLAETTIGSTDVGLGAVLVLRADNERALFVRKAARSQYEFSNTLAFPGGMIRSLIQLDDFRHHITHALNERLRDETGLRISTDSFGSFGSPVATRYTAKGRLRTVIVLPYHVLAAVDSDTLSSQTIPSASSISFAGWLPLSTLNWQELAPANCVIAAQALWSDLSAPLRRSAIISVRRALRECNEIAKELGIPIIPDTYFPI